MLLAVYAMLIRSRCPCLTCSVKIAQVGISEVVYSQEYNVDAKVCPHVDVVKLLTFRPHPSLKGQGSS